MSKTMYRAHSYRPEIEAVEVVKQTASFATVVEIDWGQRKYERRVKIEGVLFPTWQACKDHQIAHYQRVVEGCKQQLNNARSRLGNWESLKDAP
jgi:hypothetical protein